MQTHPRRQNDDVVRSRSGADQSAIDELCINTIRTLSIDAVGKAQSGHPGTPMGAASTAYWLWQQFLRFDPADPQWPNRDRFVLSSGHASMLLYSLLFLADVRAGTHPNYEAPDAPAVSLDDIKQFREAGSHCAGHPERTLTAGVETTTGPLGQGVATSVGMAAAGQWLAATYNRPARTIFDYNVYALCSDGDLMEGVASEAASLAGHLRLPNLCWIYDDNHVTIEGNTNLTFTEDVGARFLGYGWNVLHVGDANDRDQLVQAYQAFLETADRPTLIIVASHIGYGAPDVQDTSKAHGEPLSAEEARRAKESYGWPPDAQFLVPDGVREHVRAGYGERGTAAHAAWQTMFEQYRQQYPDLANDIESIQHHTLPAGWADDVPTFPPDAKGMPTRQASARILNAIGAKVPWLIGGAADLASSTMTRLDLPEAGDFQATPYDGSYAGRNFHFGIREHAMCAAVNGMALAGIRSYGAGYLIFTDYARPAIRLSALMELPVIYIWTHDSISIGQDGPTHQPIEQLASFRAMPGVLVLRPADANEVAAAWRVVMQLTDRPALLVLTRQAVPTLDRTRYASADGVARGAYVVADAPHGRPEVLLLASGSEVSLCLVAQGQLAADGIEARVVSMPCWELFESQSLEYREAVLPPAITARVAIEEAATFGWERYAGTNGAILGMQSFGMSAPTAVVQQHFGFEPAHVVAAAQEQVARVRRIAATS